MQRVYIANETGCYVTVLTDDERRIATGTIKQLLVNPGTTITFTVDNPNGRFNKYKASITTDASHSNKYVLGIYDENMKHKRSFYNTDGTEYKPIHTGAKAIWLSNHTTRKPTEDIVVKDVVVVVKRSVLPVILFLFIIILAVVFVIILFSTSAPETMGGETYEPAPKIII